MSRKPFERKDRFYHLAKKQGYPARSAYKIMELDDRFKIFKKGSCIVDLGCAPGGWLKVAMERMQGKGKIVGIDLLPLAISPDSITTFIQGDFTDEETCDRLVQILDEKKADWVLSDMSPDLSGIKFRDEFLSFELAALVIKFARENLRSGGSVIFKIFPGIELEKWRPELKKSFTKVQTVLPEATRKSSTEIYLVCLGYH